MPYSPGTRLGPYEILALAGAGGMGEVYRARDTRLDREVALKVLSPSLAATPELRARFEREARAVAGFQHPHICVLHDVGEADGAPFLVMEYLEGETLSDRLRRGPLTAAELSRIGTEIASALDRAHRAGLVHRDLKPGNVMLTKAGAKLLDFGLAKPVTPGAAAPAPSFTAMTALDSPLTQAGAIMGTVRYMSPEQIEGRPADARSDIFALGALLYECASGKPAFEGKTNLSIASAILEREPEPILPPGLDWLVRACLAKDPEARLQSAHDVALQLARALAAPPAPPPAPPNPRRRPWVWALSGVALAAAAALLAWHFVPRPASVPPLHFSAVTSFAGVQTYPALSPDGRSVAFVSNRTGPYNLYITLLGGGSPVQITHDANLKGRLAWSPDGATLAYAALNPSGLWDIWEIPALGGTAHRVILGGNDPSWSPDGASLVFVRDAADWLAGANGENPHRVASPPPGFELDEPRFSHDGKYLAVAARSSGGGPYGELGIVDLASGKTRMLTQDGALVVSPAWAPGDHALYFASSRSGTLNLWRIGTDGTGRRQLTAGAGDDAEFDLSADGKRLVFATLQQHTGIGRLDLAAPTTVPIPLTTDSARIAFAPEYSPDGHHLAYFSDLKGIQRESINVADADGANAVTLVQDNSINLFPQWAPDSQHIIYFADLARGNDQFRSVAISGGTPQLVMAHGSGAFATVGRDGRLLYSQGNRLQAFDPRTGRTAVLATFPYTPQWARWAPDQRAVAFVVNPARQDDPQAGLWLDDFQHPPRQLARGWVPTFAATPGPDIVYLVGHPDHTATLWRTAWQGKGSAQMPFTIPLLQTNYRTDDPGTQEMALSPDGHSLALEVQSVLQSNLGLLENLPIH